MNTSQLIASIKLKGSFPTDNFFSISDYLSILNDQLKLDIIPLLMRLNEDYFLADKDYPITAGATYRIPKRAIGSKLRDVKIIDVGGNYRNLPRLYEEDRASAQSGYYIKKNSVELSKDITAGTLRLSYFAAPNTLVSTTSCGQITSIESDLNQVTVASAPSTFINGASIDLIQNNNPYDVMSMDIPIVSISGTTITFSALPVGIEIGDWIALSGQSPVATIPEELQPVLVQSALCTCLTSKKDNSAQVEMQKLEMMKTSAITMLDPRVESPDTKIRPNGILNHFRNR